ncbi:MAG: serine--tRNA ligase [Nanoarchaeota archaeon]|nr:serine--tRNA ligase [Nanoarchaeota archaeon]
MLDAKLIEEKPELLKKSVKERGLNELLKKVDEFVKLRKDWKFLKTKLDSLRHERNKISLSINEAIKSNNKQEAETKKKRAKEISEDVKKTEEKIILLDRTLKYFDLEFPNLIDKLPKKDRIVEKHGKEKKEKWMKNYEELNKNLKIVDFDTAVNMSGTGFYTLIGDGAKLERALINFFLDMRKKQGYKEVSVPFLVTEEAMINSGQLPKFKEDMFVTQENLYLIPTSEVPLLNLYAGKFLNENELPIYVTAYSPCFRVEKGATKGFFRVKQFSKVELFKFVKQEDSFKELDKILKDAVETLKKLGLTYRVKILSAEEIGFASAKTYDIEVYTPFNGWLEVSSCSNCTDFQSRRAKIKYINKKGEKKFVHTLNGSGLAVPRVIISILENCQQKDGSIKIPKTLKSYFGKDKIKIKEK